MSVPLPFDPQALLERALPSVRQRYEARDTILYGLGVGAAQGADAWDERHLRFVYEQNLQALPTLCAMLGDPGFWMREPDTALQWRSLVHGEQSMQWLRPLPAAAEVIGHNRVIRVQDRGEGRGALFVVEREICSAATGEVWVRCHTTVMARGNGGFSPAAGPLVSVGVTPAPAAPAMPERAPDHIIIRPTSTQQSLLYRLSSDLNPLHADPAVARAAGFPRPIMHGMCTLGILGLLLVCDFCEFDGSRLAALYARFTAALYPGETLRCEFWEQGDLVQFRATSIERNTIVLDRGWAQVRPQNNPSGETPA
ncbi:MAG: MaoC/PaaZ C-terminal domain-containing protein [Rhodoferax sp.]